MSRRDPRVPHVSHIGVDGVWAGADSRPGQALLPPVVRDGDPDGSTHRQRLPGSLPDRPPTQRARP